MLQLCGKKEKETKYEYEKPKFLFNDDCNYMFIDSEHSKNNKIYERE
jgi:hypothetical protein